VRSVKHLLGSRGALFAAVVIVAAGIAAALIVVSVVGSSDSKKVNATPIPATTGAATPGTTAPGSTTAPEPGFKVSGGAATAKLFRGIPQNKNVLGNPKAPVTMVEFADLQCPFCRDYALDALPTIIREYVRPRKVKLVFAGIAFIGPDSETALRATYAAALQNRLWNFLDLLYRNQGAENSGWVTEPLLRATAQAIPGVDVGTLLAARQSTEVDNALLATQQQASSARVSSTPSFFAGPTGGTLNRINLTSLTPSAFRPTLDALLK
jgi:protein-disulfide isomerase